jgi:hypothetical protein
LPFVEVDVGVEVDELLEVGDVDVEFCEDAACSFSIFGTALAKSTDIMKPVPNSRANAVRL